MSAKIQHYLKKLHHPEPTLHKGQNGKLLVIGGSQLFHSSIFWSADVASRVVDMAHFTSPANENNELVRFKLKQGFWQGIVVDWSEVENYLVEDDVALIGPGMERGEETKNLVDDLLKKFPEKKWVIDGGALQEIDPKLLNKNCLITPHAGEWQRLVEKTTKERLLSQGVTILAKGYKKTKDQVIDVAMAGDGEVEIAGGNVGLAKGGTGDVLAGLVAALYCRNEALVAAVVGSLWLKQAADYLYQKRGHYYNPAELIDAIFRFPVD